MEKENNIESKRICKYGLQIESCRQCLFETLCAFEERQKLNSLDNNQ